MDNISDGIIWYIAFLFSTTIHESMHALVGYLLGDSTAHSSGHVTLSPIPHIKREPIGMVAVPIISFILSGWMIGWASVPFSIGWALTYPKRSALMSLAGPTGNLILIIGSAIFIHIGISAGFFIQPESINFTQIVTANAGGYYVVLAKFLSILFSLNLILLVFNLLPIPPLDGGGVLPLFLSKKNGAKFIEMTSKGGGIFGLLIAWQLFGLVYSDVHIFVINLLYWGSNYQ